MGNDSDLRVYNFKEGEVKIIKNAAANYDNDIYLEDLKQLED